MRWEYDQEPMSKRAVAIVDSLVENTRLSVDVDGEACPSLRRYGQSDTRVHICHLVDGSSSLWRSPRTLSKVRVIAMSNPCRAPRIPSTSLTPPRTLDIRTTPTALSLLVVPIILPPLYSALALNSVLSSLVSQEALATAS
jgi:hypothetical protein